MVCKSLPVAPIIKWMVLVAIHLLFLANRGHQLPGQDGPTKVIRLLETMFGLVTIIDHASVTIGDGAIIASGSVVTKM